MTEIEEARRRAPSQIKIGDYYLRQMKDLADAWFKELLMDVRIDTNNMIFVIWVEKGMHEEEIKKFEKKYSSTSVMIWEKVKRNLTFKSNKQK